MKADIKQIKQRASVIETARSLGLNLTAMADGSFRSASFIHNGTNPMSVWYQHDHWYSFSDDRGGDVIDLVAIVKYGGDKGKAIRDLAAQYSAWDESAQTDNYDQWVQYTRDLNNNVAYWHTQLKPEHIEYLHARNISDETIKELRIGWDGQRIVIPCYKNGYVCYYVRRAWGSDQPKYLKPKQNGLLENTLNGLDTLGRSSDLLVIAEGAFDYLSFRQEGYAVLSGIGKPSHAQLRLIRDIASAYRRILLTFDRDDVSRRGQIFDRDVFDALQGLNKPIQVAQIPSTVTDTVTGEVCPCKDVSDWYSHAREVRTLVDNAIDGYLYRATQFTDFESMAAWLRRASMNLSDRQIKRIVDALITAHAFNEDDLSDLGESLCKPPSEPYIESVCMSEHTIVYAKGLGFHRYYDGYWHACDDSQIKQIVGRTLGRWKTKSRVNAVAELLHNDTYSETVQFNRTNCVNFRNGTIDIPSTWEEAQSITRPVLRSPRKEDYLSYQLPYDYDPEATSDEWVRFVADISDCDLSANEPTDYNTLQQFAGYILMPNNKYEQALVLEGEGSNGKSVFIDTLTAVFGGLESGNVTGVSVTQLAMPFYPILLANSMLNVNSEMKSDVSGATEIFKMAVSGQPITSSQKGKDNKSFCTRAKFIVSLNGYLQSEDSSEGFFRRLLVVNFPNHYSDHPVPDIPTERLADRQLPSRLMSPVSLSGIFNWVYDGYVTVLQYDQIYRSERSVQNRTEMEVSNDPVYAFALEYKPQSVSGWISTDDLFLAYLSYCDENNNHYRTNKTKFGQRMARLSKQSKIPYVKQRQASRERTNGWQYVERTEAEVRMEDWKYYE